MKSKIQTRIECLINIEKKLGLQNNIEYINAVEEISNRTREITNAKTIVSIIMNNFKNPKTKITKMLLTPEIEPIARDAANNMSIFLDLKSKSLADFDEVIGSLDNLFNIVEHQLGTRLCASLSEYVSNNKESAMNIEQWNKLSRNLVQTIYESSFDLNCNDSFDYADQIISKNSIEQQNLIILLDKTVEDFSKISMELNNIRVSEKKQHFIEKVESFKENINSNSFKVESLEILASHVRQFRSTVNLFKANPASTEPIKNVETVSSTVTNKKVAEKPVSKQSKDNANNNQTKSTTANDKDKKLVGLTINKDKETKKLTQPIKVDNEQSFEQNGNMVKFKKTVLIAAGIVVTALMLKSCSKKNNYSYNVPSTGIIETSSHNSSNIITSDNSKYEYEQNSSVIINNNENNYTSNETVETQNNSTSVPSITETTETFTSESINGAADSLYTNWSIFVGDKYSKDDIKEVIKYVNGLDSKLTIEAVDSILLDVTNAAVSKSLMNGGTSTLNVTSLFINNPSGLYSLIELENYLGYLLYSPTTCADQCYNILEHEYRIMVDHEMYNGLNLSNNNDTVNACINLVWSRLAIAANAEIGMVLPADCSSIYKGNVTIENLIDCVQYEDIAIAAKRPHMSAAKELIMIKL